MELTTRLSVIGKTAPPVLLALEKQGHSVGVTVATRDRDLAVMNNKGGRIVPKR